ncbi:MAG: rhodanese-like domain-containing protein, partial [Verrucomicrobiota bacterium]|nr:rhodanese-like domain-containing protein [Verrucomicrobiota bacterium]
MKSEDAPVSAATLKQLLDDEPKPVLIDVLPEEYFSVEHLPGAKNACVYNIDFLDLVRKAVPNLKHKVVVYGSSAKNLASAVALSKLVEAGWKNVANFKGGLTEWREAGYRVEGTHEKKDQPTLVDKTYCVDTEQSLIEWIGRGIGGKHNGTLKLSYGELAIRGGNVTNGRFIIDMTSIADTDIT